MLACPAWAQNPGEIVFADGSSVEFLDFVEWRNKGTGSPDLEVFYENSTRKLPVKHLSSVEVKQFEVMCKDYRNPCITGAINVITKSKIKFVSPVNKMFGIKVKILDKLTGEIKSQNYYFIERNSSRKSYLNVKKILFE
jgi:hypothetical protein